MNELYAEAGVKRRQTATNYLLRGLMIALILLLLTMGTMIIGAAAFTIAIAVAVVCFYWFPRMNVEYEYVFCDGQLDFDRISGGAKRKTLLRIDLDKVELVAPVNSHALDNYNNNQQLKTKDFSSLDKSAAMLYAIMLREEGITRILFEPSEKMLDCMKQKAPRKIVRE